ncbi:hypothetical protein Tsubulata_046750 [Turnera subulata]|uniref:Uncharacterized protein n=1 Tax=Turnera subulata TaxID=218843 RepID=A0A9Q0JCZ8_9ROSI|nr:hypothetical protein Tsubulata_046750 [Turnera subulata]
MALSLSFPIVILCLFISIDAGLGYSQSQDLVKSFLGNNQVVSRPILNKLHQLINVNGGGYYHVATVYPFKGLQHWEGECFKKNNAWLTYSQDHLLAYVVVEVSEGRSLFCKDYYQFKTGDRLLAEDSFYSSILTKEVKFDSADLELRKYITRNGVQVYMWRSGNNYQQDQEEKVMEALTSDGGGASATV